MLLTYGHQYIHFRQTDTNVSTHGAVNWEIKSKHRDTYTSRMELKYIELEGKTRAKKDMDA